MARSGRFEWIAIPRQAHLDPAGSNTQSAAAAPARMCPECGWLDSVERFEALSGEPGIRECRRCGQRWDLIHEINLFLNYENLKLPEVRLVRNCGDIKRFYHSNADHPRLFERFLRAQRSGLQKGFEHLMCLHTACDIE
ncbi:MAG: hypothetical protein P8X90_24175, partial [Desulfobacterales bacterium]